MFESIAYAADAATTAGAPQGNPVMSLLPIFFMIAVMYFLLFRPQQKRQKALQELVNNLKKGDKVITAGGLIGTVASIQNDYVVMKMGDNDQTKMEVLKSSISGLRK